MSGWTDGQGFVSSIRQLLQSVRKIEHLKMTSVNALLYTHIWVSACRLDWSLRWPINSPTPVCHNILWAFSRNCRSTAAWSSTYRNIYDSIWWSDRSPTKSLLLRSTATVNVHAEWIIMIVGIIIDKVYCIM